MYSATRAWQGWPSFKYEDSLSEALRRDTRGGNSLLERAPVCKNIVPIDMTANVFDRRVHGCCVLKTTLDNSAWQGSSRPAVRHSYLAPLEHRTTIIILVIQR